MHNKKKKTPVTHLNPICAKQNQLISCFVYYSDRKMSLNELSPLHTQK